MIKCGFYEREITPPLGADMRGYYTHRYATDVRDPIYAKACVFSDGRGIPANCGALLIVDAVELHAPQVDAIIARASAYTGIPANNISVAATHTHLGIPCGDVVSDEDTALCSCFAALLPTVSRWLSVA